MSVYFIQSGREGPIKIGHTSGSVISRVNNLQTGNPSRLHLLLEIEGGRGVELELHNRFASARFRNEWFWPTDPILAFIKSPSLAQPPSTTSRLESGVSLREQVVERARKHVSHKVSLKTISYRLTGDGKILPKLAKGKGDVTTARFEDIMSKLDGLESEAA